jgi:hypothetical protein
MGKIRINELARELELKTNVVLEYLAELRIPDDRSHSSALDDELADRVREHFMPEDEKETLRKEAARPLTRNTAKIKPAKRKA